MVIVEIPDASQSLLCREVRGLSFSSISFKVVECLIRTTVSVW